MSRRFVLFCLIWLVLPPAWAEGVIHLILSDNGAAYQEASDAFRAEIGSRAAVKVWTLQELAAEQAQILSRTTGLLAPVGVKAARFVAEHHVGQAPVLALMIPRAASEKLEWPSSLGRRKISGIFIDQPPSRSLGLVEAAFPAARRVGLVISPENAGVIREFGKEATQRNLRLVVETINSPEEVASALRRVLQDSDALLLVPDAIAINAGNAQNVLLTTYRFRIPVIGFSQGLSRAGAVASVYSTPRQIGQQGAQFALRLEDSGELPPPQHAGEFSVGFNPHVARSLGIALPNEADIRRKLGARRE
jgi:putative tryptophan/tyrosine transport system substrate-binding protein